MIYSLTYRRPAHVTCSQDSLSGEEKQKSIQDSIQSGNSCMSGGIPQALSFDRIVAGGTCPPVTVRDFMNYLKYIERSAENLQFFLWFREYSERWASLPEREQALSPPWEQSKAESAHANRSPAPPKKATPQIAAAFKGTDFADDRPETPVDWSDAFCAMLVAASLDDRRDLQSEHGSSVDDDRTLLNTPTTNHCFTAGQAFEDAGMQWQPFTAQPFRDELTRIVSVYLAEGSARELNLSSRERRRALHALQHTTHPSALREIATTVEHSLRRQAHPNFIRWTICNGNRPRVVFARALGVATIVAAFVADLLLALSTAGRGWRVLLLPLWLLGFATLIAAWKGMCVVLHGLHHRHLRPWELFADEEEAAATAVAEGTERKSTADLACTERTSSSDSLANSFEDEPWVPRYRRRNIVRKIFDRQVWVREPALRQIQDTIFVQALLGATLLSGLAVGVFAALPHGRLY